MNQKAINLTKVAIKHYEDEKLRLTSEILSCRIKIEQAEKDVSRIDNIKHSLRAALEKLEEADEKEETREEMEFIEKQDLSGLLEDPQELKESSGTGKIMEEAEPGEELSDEEKDKATLEKADRLIAAGKEAMKKEKKGWAICPKCNKNKIAPWNKKGICSPCQLKRKTKPNL